MTTKPSAIFLKDYRVPNWLIEHVELDVDIFAGETFVTSNLKVYPHPQGEKGDLILSGERMELKSVSVDGKPLSADQYTVSAQNLVIHGLAGKHDVTTRVRIQPENNKALEGFYQSGDILCTQCEAEGFRKITYYLDRPDVMAKFRVTLKADKKRYPLLLANGNRVKEGDLTEGRHFVTWEDPFKKPCYLFAMVAGNLEKVSDHFTTKSGRKVVLEIYVDHGNGHKCGHAMQSLKNSMKWDEERWGLEYDLDIYMIVAVESFNFGAMENKGLNIFNSAYVLADPKTATDKSFANVEGVIGHEYFHNWTGNRVTCRDWFQLTLKEGLTVFRDQEFSSDMLSREVKRIEDVRRLKEMQFTEDAGPMSHPIRPSQYIEINNFYTATIYEKGAEVIRMIHTLVGTQNFRKGIDLYFQRHDGQAVTTEDFVAAMSDASGKDLTQFRNWYSRSGTPRLICSGKWDQTEKQYTLKIEQQYPPVLNERLENNVLHIPFKVACYNHAGKQIMGEKLLEITKLKESFTFDGITEKPILSLNRGFTAPVHVEFDTSDEELFVLAGHDNDGYARSEALRETFRKLLVDYVTTAAKKMALPSALPDAFKNAITQIITGQSIDEAFKAKLLEIPSKNELLQEMDEIDPAYIVTGHNHFIKLMAEGLRQEWQTAFIQTKAPAHNDQSAKAMGARAWRNRCLQMWLASHNNEAQAAAFEHFTTAGNLTDETAALEMMCQTQHPKRQVALDSYYQKWQHEPLVLMHWFSIQSRNVTEAEAKNVISKLEADTRFRKDVPNDLRSLYGTFGLANFAAFHAVDGSGYQLMADRIAKIDGFNPQVAARLSGCFAVVGKLTGERKTALKKALGGLLNGPLSNDLYEVVSRYHAGP